MQDDEKKVKFSDKKPVPPAFGVKLKEPSLESSSKVTRLPRAQAGDMEALLSDENKMRTREKQHYSYSFYKRIADITDSNYRKWFFSKKACSNMVGVYKLRRGIFCDCEPASVNTLPPDKSIKLWPNQPIQTYCKTCGRTSQRSLFRNTKLSGEKMAIEKVFYGFYLWSRSKAAVGQCPVKGYYADDNDNKFSLTRVVKEAQLASKLGIPMNKAKTYLEHYQFNFMTFWAELVVPQEIYEAIVPKKFWSLWM